MLAGRGCSGWQGAGQAVPGAAKLGYSMPCRPSPPLATRPTTRRSSGQQLVRTLLAGVGHDVARAHVPSLASVLWALQQHAPQFQEWLLSVLGQDDFPTPRVSLQTREALATQLLRESINKKEFTETVSDLSVVARGLC